MVLVNNDLYILSDKSITKYDISNESFETITPSIYEGGIYKSINEISCISYIDIGGVKNLLISANLTDSNGEYKIYRINTDLNNTQLELFYEGSNFTNKISKIFCYKNSSNKSIVYAVSNDGSQDTIYRLTNKQTEGFVYGNQNTDDTLYIEPEQLYKPLFTNLSDSSQGLAINKFIIDSNNNLIDYYTKIIRCYKTTQI